MSKGRRQTCRYPTDETMQPLKHFTQSVLCNQYKVSDVRVTLNASTGWWVLISHCCFWWLQNFDKWINTSQIFYNLSHNRVKAASLLLLILLPLFLTLSWNSVMSHSSASKWLPRFSAAMYLRMFSCLIPGVRNTSLSFCHDSLFC